MAGVATISDAALRHGGVHADALVFPVESWFGRYAVMMPGAKPWMRIAENRLAGRA
jgi:hypothetical protein